MCFDIINERINKMVENQDIPDIFKNAMPLVNDDAEHLQKKAEDVIRSLAKTYLENVHVQIQDLRRFIDEARIATGMDRTKLFKESIFKTAHDIKGQGATFGYPLLTVLGAHICDKIRGVDKWSNDVLNDFEQDIADMETVVKFPPNSQNSTLMGIEKRIEGVV